MNLLAADGTYIHKRPTLTTAALKRPTKSFGRRAPGCIRHAARSQQSTARALLCDSLCVLQRCSKRTCVHRCAVERGTSRDRDRERADSRPCTMPSILAQAASPTGLTSEQRPPPAIGNMSSTLRQTIETSGAPPAPQASRRAKPAAGQNGARRPLATPPSERSRSGGGGRKSPTPQRPSTPLRVEPPPALAAGSLCSTSGTSTPGAAAAAASAAMSASAGGGGLAARLVVPMLAIPLKPALPAVVETVDKPTKLAADRRLQRARLAL